MEASLTAVCIVDHSRLTSAPPHHSDNTSQTRRLPSQALRPWPPQQGPPSHLEALTLPVMDTPPRSNTSASMGPPDEQSPVEPCERSAAFSIGHGHVVMIPEGRDRNRKEKRLVGGTDDCSFNGLPT
ncbi:unnamed protein product [Gadus morhua 'NCC']